MVNVLTLQEQAQLSTRGLPGLMLASEYVASSVQAGAHGRRRVGAGDSFWQFREYDGYESASRIDWRQSAKRDRLSVREQEWAALQIAMLWVDDSPSMNFASYDGIPTKLEAARIVALALAMLLVKSGEAAGSADQAVKPGCNKGKAEELAAWLLNERNADLPHAMDLKPHRQQVWFSDTLFDQAVLHQALQRHAAAEQPGLLIQVVDPGEVELPFSGRQRFEGLEGEDDWLVQKTEAIGEAYAEKWQAHMAGVKSLVKAAGWRHVILRTDQNLSLSLANVHKLLSGALT